MDENEELKAGRRHSQRDMSLLARVAALSSELSAIVADLGAVQAEQAVQDAQDEGGETTGVPATFAPGIPPAIAAMSFNYVKALRIPGAGDAVATDEQLSDQLAVKRIGRDTIGGYLALWGDEARVDVESEFFTKATDFWDGRLSYPRPLTWDHALDPSFKGEPIIGSVIEAGDDEVGRWYVAQLERNHQYRKAIDALIDRRAIGTSSDSAPQYVVRERTKSGAVWLRQWPLFAAALTATPCEPRMLDVGLPRWKSIAAGLAGSGEQDRRQEGKEDAGRTAGVSADGGLDSRIEASRRWHEVLKLG